MLDQLPRRQRLVVFTAGAAGVVAILLVVLLWLLPGRTSTYIPGEQIEGLTADLARSLPEDYPRITFRDVSDQAGIRFQHFPFTRTTQLPEDMGSGAAWGDYNNDGWLDLYVVNQSGSLGTSPDQTAQSQAHAHLYRNNQDGTFTEVSEEAGVDFRGIGMGAAWGDYDNDGWPDLVVTSYGKNVLYRNNGNGTFTDVTTQAGMNAPDGFWAGASWGDYDRDGDLDLYICGYVRYTPETTGGTSLQYETEMPASLNPSSFRPERNLLYRNNGNGSFTGLAVQAGVDDPDGRSLSASRCDFDEDGWPDLYVANDVSDNVLYRNNGDGSFQEISHRALVADYRGAMGIATGDWDNDRDVDMFVTHWIAQENALYNNLKTQLDTLQLSAANAVKFMDVADRYGLGQIALDYVGFGAGFFDYNNDGRLDIFITNGSTIQQDADPHLLTPMRDQLFWNSGPEDGFYDVSAVSGPVFRQELVGRGAAIGDYDNDGDLDVFVVNNQGPAQLLQNEGGNQQHWLTLAFHGIANGSSGTGSSVDLFTGNTSQSRQVGAQSSYLSQHSPRAHFGLGSTTTVDSIRIVWPDGHRQILRDIPADQILAITRL